jgi:hypothetical protein
MLALGSCIAGSGILILGLLALLFQHPNAPWWTRPLLVPMLICIPVAGTIGLGLVFIMVGLWQLLRGTGDPLELVVLAAVVIGLKVVWRVFIRRRLNAYATSGISLGARLTGEPALVIDETNAPPPGRS